MKRKNEFVDGREKKKKKISSEMPEDLISCIEIILAQSEDPHHPYRQMMALNTIEYNIRSGKFLSFLNASENKGLTLQINHCNYFSSILIPNWSKSFVIDEKNKKEPPLYFDDNFLKFCKDNSILDAFFQSNENKLNSSHRYFCFSIMTCKTKEFSDLLKDLSKNVIFLETIFSISSSYKIKVESLNLSFLNWLLEDNMPIKKDMFKRFFLEENVLKELLLPTIFPLFENENLNFDHLNLIVEVLEKASYEQLLESFYAIFTSMYSSRFPDRVYFRVQYLFDQLILQYFDAHKRFFPRTTKAFQTLILFIENNRASIHAFTKEDSFYFLCKMHCFYRIICLIKNNDYTFISHGFNGIFLENQPFYYIHNNNKFTLSVNTFIEGLKAAPILRVEGRVKDLSIRLSYINDRGSFENDVKPFENLVDFLKEVPDLEGLNLELFYFNVNSNNLNYLANFIKDRPALKKIHFSCYFGKHGLINMENFLKQLADHKAHDIKIQLIIDPDIKVIKEGSSHPLKAVNIENQRTIQTQVKLIGLQREGVSCSRNQDSFTIIFKREAPSLSKETHYLIEKYQEAMSFLYAYNSEIKMQEDFQKCHRNLIYSTAVLSKQFSLEDLGLSIHTNIYNFAYSLSSFNSKRLQNKENNTLFNLSETFLKFLEKNLFLCAWTQLEMKNTTNKIEMFMGKKIWNNALNQKVELEDQIQVFIHYVKNAPREILIAILMKVSKNEFVSPLNTYQAVDLSLEDYELCKLFFKENNCFAGKDEISAWSDEQLKNLVLIILHCILGPRFYLFDKNLKILIINDKEESYKDEIQIVKISNNNLFLKNSSNIANTKDHDNNNDDASDSNSDQDDSNSPHDFESGDDNEIGDCSL